MASWLLNAMFSKPENPWPDEPDFDGTTAVIVGGGPQGLLTALMIRMLFTRVIVLDKAPFAAATYYIHLALDNIVPTFAKELFEGVPSFGTYEEIQRWFRHAAAKHNIVLMEEEVKDKRQLLRFKPSIIIGADGIHSLVRTWINKQTITVEQTHAMAVTSYRTPNARILPFFELVKTMLAISSSSTSTSTGFEVARANTIHLVWQIPPDPTDDAFSSEPFFDAAIQDELIDEDLASSSTTMRRDIFPRKARMNENWRLWINHRRFKLDDVVCEGGARQSHHYLYNYSVPTIATVFPHFDDTPVFLIGSAAMAVPFWDALLLGAQHAALLVSILDEYNDGVGSSATMRYQAAMEAMDQLVRLELYEHLETCKIQTKYMRTAKIAQVHTLSQEETELFYSANIYQGLPKQILTNQSRGWESVNARSRANWPNISSV